MALRKDQAAKMQSLLTPEQKNKMVQLKAEGKAKAEQHYAARMDKMKAKLNLTDKQVAQMQTQRETMKAKFKAIKEDDKMDRTAKKEKLMALKSEMKEEHKKIFTPEQLQKMEEMKKARMEKKDVK
jgi:Spy/CpxP family protein refolding chaperone